jgi:hypothetical protein
MNLIVLGGFALGCLGLLWIVQALALTVWGEGTIWVWPYHHTTKSPQVRWALKFALHTALLSTLVLYPCAIGQNPWHYHRDRLTLGEWRLIPLGIGVPITLLTAVFLINLALGWIHFSAKYRASKLALKIAKSFLIPLPLTLVEEPLFRGIVVEQFWNAQYSRAAGPFLAIVLASLLFAAAHFIRPQKRTVLPALGLFMLGILLSLAYLRTGHHYLLPMAIHAGGVWFIQATRPLAEYRGPSWLIGYSSYPICGGMGLAVLALVGIIVLP